MASNPPFQVEDQTDEDFFDKLVDDEFGPTTTTGTNSQFTDGNDSDDAKAFANLTISETETALEDSVSGGGENNSFDFEGKGGKDRVGGSAESFGAHAEERNSLVSSNSVGCDSTTESSNDGRGSEFISDATMSKSIGSAGSGVKEVGWNSFHADSEQNSNKGFGSYSDFFNDLGGDSGGLRGDFGDSLNKDAKSVSAYEEGVAGGVNNYANYKEGQVHGSSTEQNTNLQDLNNSQYWENLYPGWNYDPNTGQWYQVDSYDATAAVGHESSGDWGVDSDGRTEVSYMQQAAQSVLETATHTSTTESVSNWSQVLQGNNGYPDHIVFDPQYPGWYYDTTVQEWRALDAYTSSTEVTAQDHGQQHQNGFVSAGSLNQDNNRSYGEYVQADNYGFQGFGNQGSDGSLAGAYNNTYHQDLRTWSAETVPKREAFATLGGNQQLDNSNGSKASVNFNQQKSFNSFEAVSYNGASQAHSKANGTVEFKSFIPDGNFGQQFNPSNPKLSEQTQFSNNYFGNQKHVNLSQQSFESGHQTSYAPNVGRSSAGRPPHPLVTFGFGGKLIVMKDNSSLSSSSYGSQVGR